MTQLTPKAEELEEALQTAAVLDFGATWHGIAKRQMMAQGICKVIVEELGITEEVVVALRSYTDTRARSDQIAGYLRRVSQQADGLEALLELAEESESRE